MSPQIKQLALPRLNGIQPTLESTVIKLSEEVGELARLIGKGQRMSGESYSDTSDIQREWLMEVVGELLDVAQTTITMAFKLEEEYDISLEDGMENHINKLKHKKYII